ncbi:rbm-25 [Pristionchus pacificus]|nr:rbm-25 [Pristionchus pacificus]
MAGPPRFTSMPQMGNGFRMNFGGPPQPLIGSMMRPTHGGGPANQVTTVFVGNISEKADNEFVKQMLEMCGKVVAWKRMAGVSGKLQVFHLTIYVRTLISLQGFGFCDFEEPEDTLRALRVLNDFQLGDKKLIVKVEQKHRDQLKAFAEKEAGQPAKPNSEELPASDKALRKDENVRLKILEAIEKDYPDLVKFEDGELEEKEKDAKLKEAKKEGEESKDRKDGRRTKRSRSQSGSRSRSPQRRERRRSRSPRNKRRRRSSRSSSRSSSGSRSSRSSSRSSSYDSRDRKRRSRRSRSTSRATYASEDSEDAREKRAIKRQIKEKEMAYAARLREWEGREKKMAKKYEKDEAREKNRKASIYKYLIYINIFIFSWTCIRRRRN